MDKKEINRHKIIKDSIQLMYLNGYNATSVNDIVKAAKIPKGSFYYYFSSKEEYTMEALDFYVNIMGSDAFKILSDSSLKPLDRIKKFYKNKILSMKKSEFKLGCFLGNLSQELGDVNNEFSMITNKYHNEIVLKIFDCIEEAVANDQLKPKININILADTILNSWQGALLRMTSSRDAKPLDEFYIVLEDLYLL